MTDKDYIPFAADVEISSELDSESETKGPITDREYEFSMTIELDPDLERFLGIDRHPMPDDWKEKHR